MTFTKERMSLIESHGLSPQHGRARYLQPICSLTMGLQGSAKKVNEHTSVVTATFIWNILLS